DLAFWNQAERRPDVCGLRWTSRPAGRGERQIRHVESQGTERTELRGDAVDRPGASRGHVARHVSKGAPQRSRRSAQIGCRDRERTVGNVHLEAGKEATFQVAEVALEPRKAVPHA